MKNTLLCTNILDGILNKYIHFVAVCEVLSQKSTRNIPSQNVMVFQLPKTVHFIAIILSFYIFIQHLNLNRY